VDVDVDVEVVWAWTGRAARIPTATTRAKADSSRASLGCVVIIVLIPDSPPGHQLRSEVYGEFPRLVPDGS